ncbi:MAG: SAM hydrolase/SAM-dependent halogenase family protein [Flavobacteriales bacterium]
MAIITLTTDLGIEDFYLSAVKGRILNALDENVTIVDISNQIKIFDIRNAAYVLKNSFENFPKGTIHIVGVDSEISIKRQAILMEYKGHFFIGADNGLFSLIYDYPPTHFYELHIDIDTNVLTFPTRDIFAKAACHLARGGTPEIIGKKINQIVSFQKPVPQTQELFIRGSVTHIDSYGNAITNISKKLFEEIGKSRSFNIGFRNYEVNKLSNTYSEVPEGVNLALFNTSGLLEIAINRGVEGYGGSASQLLGLTEDEIVTITFNK